ncbi:MAG: anhydro-N-acetylmuramic acid kinase [Bacteroidetes bacterium]|nr:anhydro-N-acetylmuramic acid kinase [Bacteroidota bacterium]
MTKKQDNNQKSIKVIGVMSGTSLDGLDLAAVEFTFQNEKWDFNIIAAKTVSYSENWFKKLNDAPSFSGKKLIELHSEYGNFIGIKINEFNKETGFEPDLIASHGHTVFHQPEKHFTFQVGNGSEIAAVTKITTVADFRTGDVALGGQGAPLVPVGDKFLFSDFEYCLNLGGFANVSFEKENQRIAYDNCPVNFTLNHFAEKQGFPYDKNGELGRQGKLNKILLEELNNLDYYQQKPPKSLGREWMEETFFPVLEKYNISDLDKMRTLYEHVAIQIAKISSANSNLLITGGGAFNTFLIERIKQQSILNVVIPEPEIVNYKEALIFAFLGVLRIHNRINCYASVTGATKDSSCGIIFST